MNKSGTIHERITQLVNTFGKGKNTVFASLIGSNEANVRGYKTSVMPKFDFLEKIARNLDIDLKWLLTGEGSMLRTDGTPTMSSTPSTDTSALSDTVLLRLMDKLDERESKIDQLQTELRQQSAELAALKAKYHESQYKEPEPIIGLTDAFTDKSSGDYGEGFLSTKKPTTSEKFSVGKI